ncbi:MAG: type II toxin-antitoxin system RelE/ParE family toxin [Pseudomonadota bacterium]|nr:type II toxin-antitoxin system RelE/ParE family toxin [Pseudomonadota bacterium]
MPRKFESYRLSRRAEGDLADIYGYTVTNWSVQQADRYVTDIHEALEGLVAGTSIGRKRAEIAAAYLCYGVGSHVIFYRETEHILVARILHASMDLPQHLPPN